jgi:ADP-heptose:LPS heptosyltransferase
MPEKIIISQRFLEERDLGLLQGENLSFVLLPKPDLMEEKHIRRLHAEAVDADLVIIAMFGSNPNNISRLKLEQIRAPKAYWTFDSHHQWMYERAIQHLFDGMFIAHSPYRKFFDPGKSHWLPCCYTRFGATQSLNFLQTDPYREIKKFDIVFPHKQYAVGTREKMALRARELLQSKHLFCDEAESGEQYTRVLQSGSVVLNIPLLDDLNIRNFEAWLYNRVLLTIATPDMAAMKELNEATVFFRVDFSDFMQRFEEASALSLQRCNTTPLVINRHMQIHRYASLINTMLNTRICVREIDAGEATIPSESADVRGIPSTSIEEGSAFSTEGHPRNAGVDVLQNDVLAPPHFSASRLQIEDNIGEAIHIHYRNLRCDFSTRDFLHLAQKMRESLLPLGPLLHRSAEWTGKIDQSYGNALGSLTQAVRKARLEWLHLDELRIVLKKSGKWHFASIQESPVWGLLSGDAKQYHAYQEQFSKTRRSHTEFYELVKSVLVNGYPFQGQFIMLHDGEPCIRDGQHRAAILRYFFGNIKILVCILEFAEGISARMPFDSHRKRLADYVIPDNIERILYIRMDAVGDAILAGGILARLPEIFPNASVTVVCDTACAPVYGACASVERIIPLNRDRLTDPGYRADAAHLLQACRAGLVLHTTYSSTAGAHALALSANAPAIAVSGDTANMRPEDKAHWEAQYFALVPSSRKPSLELQRHADWLHWLGIRDAAPKPVVWFRDEHRVKAENLRAELGFVPDRTLLLAPKSLGLIKNYSRFVDALALVCRARGFSIAVLGAPDEADYVEAIVREYAEQGVAAANLAGRLSLPEAWAFTANSRLLVGVDTGMVHAACAVGVPNVVVLGGGHFGRFHPYSPVTTAVCLPLACYGCHWRCRYVQPYCLRGILPETVSRAVIAALERKSRATPVLYVQNEKARQTGPGQPRYRAPEKFIMDGTIKAAVKIVVDQ